MSGLIEDQQIETNQRLCDLVCFAFSFFLLERIGHFDGREEADLPVVMLDRFLSEGDDEIAAGRDG
jgi:hypothetical protein